MGIDLKEIQQRADDVKGWENINRAWLDTSEDVAVATLGHIDDDGCTYPIAVFDCEQYDAPADSIKLARFYAAVTPAVVRELIRRAEQLREFAYVLQQAAAAADLLAGDDITKKLIPAIVALREKASHAPQR